MPAVGTKFWLGMGFAESIKVNRSIILRSKNGSKNAVIDGLGMESVINVTAGYVLVGGFTIKNGSYGIRLHYTSVNSTLKENVIQQNNGGIYAFYTEGNKFFDNEIVGNRLFSINLIIPRII